MSMKCDGKHPPTKWQTALAGLRYKLQAKASRRVKVFHEGQMLRFLCHSAMEEYRVRTLYVKEEGTIAWIQGNVAPGDRFLDIGANIGIYTLVAAQKVGPEGVVYAVEPHVVNFQSLLRNIAANQYQDRVRAFSCALHSSSGVVDFNYCSLEPGTSMSQLGAVRDGEEQEFRPVARELKQAVTIDDLIASGAIEPPHHVKIDVDGNELLILEGMKKLLAGPVAPRSLQVEINKRYRDALFEFLANVGFELVQSHYTQIGKALIASGSQPQDIAHNAVFHPNKSRQMLHPAAA
jgi:FkbM family methyltransferase